MAKIAVVGAGYWGPKLIRNFYAHRECTSLWVCDKAANRLELLRPHFPDLKYTTRFEDVLSSDVDGVVLATPIHTHGDLGLRVLESGRHLFVEKPLALDLCRAEQMVEMADKRGVALMVGHTFEYSAPVRKCGELIRSGHLGSVLFMSSARGNVGLHPAGTSVLWDLAPHDFSILFSWLAETPTQIAAKGRSLAQPGVCDVACISVRFGSGTTARFEVARLAPVKLRRMTVVGDRRMIVYDDLEPSAQVKLLRSDTNIRTDPALGMFVPDDELGDAWSPKLECYEPLAMETRAFIQAIDDHRPPPSDGRSGLKVVRALRAAQESLERDGAPVAF